MDQVNRTIGTTSNPLKTLRKAMGLSLQILWVADTSALDDTTPARHHFCIPSTASDECHEHCLMLEFASCIGASSEVRLAHMTVWSSAAKHTAEKARFGGLVRLVVAGIPFERLPREGHVGLRSVGAEVLTQSNNC